jgi:hypothetical protein
MNYAGFADFQWHYDCIDLLATFNPSLSNSVSQYPTTKRIYQVLIYLIIIHFQYFYLFIL